MFSTAAPGGLNPLSGQRYIWAQVLISGEFPWALGSTLGVDPTLKKYLA